MCPVYVYACVCNTVVYCLSVFTVNWNITVFQNFHPAIFMDSLACIGCKLQLNVSSVKYG